MTKNDPLLPPPKEEKEKPVANTIRLLSATWDELRTFSEKHGVSVNRLVQHAVNRYLEELRKKAPPLKPKR